MSIEVAVKVKVKGRIIVTKIIKVDIKQIDGVNIVEFQIMTQIIVDLRRKVQ